MLLLSSLAAAIVLSASQTTPATSGRNEVVQALLTLTDGMAKCDGGKVDGLIARDFVSVGTTGALSTRDEVMSAYRSGCQAFQTSRVTDLRVRFYDDATAIVTGQIVLGSNGLPTRFTSVFVKEQNEWKSASYQGTIIASAKPAP